MKILDCEQRSEPWKAARAACLLTASDAGPFIFGTDKRSVNARRSRITRYLRQQMLDSIPLDEWEIQKRDDDERKLRYNTAINRGNALEDEARALFAQLHGVHISQPGIILTDCELFGASPDGLVHPTPEDPPNYGLELKCPELETLIDWMIDDVLPEEHMNQCHASMAISGLRTWYFMGYFRGAPPLIVPVLWDDYTQKLHDGLATFRAEMERTRATFVANWSRRFSVMGRGDA